MRIAIFCHSLLSDWNHGNAHFLRGIATELSSRGHEVRAFEPRDSWSAVNAVSEMGEDILDATLRAYPALRPRRYDLSSLELDEALDGIDLVLVHEWNDAELVRRVGEHRAVSGYRLLFHDTHHRVVTDPDAMRAYDLSHYDGVLAFGRVLRDLYVKRALSERVWIWHEAADTRVFFPQEPLSDDETETRSDLVWVGNFGDEERSQELVEFLCEPARALGLRGSVYGVRYPGRALSLLAHAGLDYRGFLPNYAVPAAFAQARVTVHVPRRPYVEALVGIPTIRPFEALACGIPLVSSPWHDEEGLFSPGEDFLVARNGEEMRRHLRAVLLDPRFALSLAAHGLGTIRARHTCAHRVDELLEIARELGVKDVSSRAPRLDGRDGRDGRDVPASAGAARTVGEWS
jgi:spore maturation protein CgeB